MPVLETERLLLRLPVEDDIGLVAEAMADAEVMRYIGEPVGYEEAVEGLARMLRAWSADGFGRFVVVRKIDGAPLGVVGLLVWNPATWRPAVRSEIGERAEVELGWTLVRSAWGFGYATEAALAVRDWALVEVRPRRLISLIHADNTRSLRVAAKLGEHFERDVTTHRGLHVQLWTS